MNIFKYQNPVLSVGITISCFLAPIVSIDYRKSQNMSFLDEGLFTLLLAAIFFSVWLLAYYIFRKVRTVLRGRAKK